MVAHGGSYVTALSAGTRDTAPSGGGVATSCAARKTRRHALHSSRAVGTDVRYAQTVVGYGVAGRTVGGKLPAQSTGRRAGPTCARSEVPRRGRYHTTCAGTWALPRVGMARTDEVHVIPGRCSTLRAVEALGQQPRKALQQQPVSVVELGCGARRLCREAGSHLDSWSIRSETAASAMANVICVPGKVLCTHPAASRRSSQAAPPPEQSERELLHSPTERGLIRRPGHPG